MNQRANSAPVISFSDSVEIASLGSDRARVRQALAMWSAGDFDGCVVQLDEIGLARHSSDSILLRARALLRVHRIEEAEKWLRMMESRHSDEDAIATHAMLLGNACARLDKFERAAVLFDRARSVATHPTVVAETAYYHALALWQARDYKTARSVLQPAVVAKQDNVSARALQLLGFIGVAEGKYAEAHTSFELALAALSRCQTKDLHLEATLIHQLAIGVAEVELRDPTHLDQLAHALAWTSNLVMEQVQTLRHIGLAYARAGQPHKAIARFIEAGGVRTQSPWAIVGFAEAANLCRQLNEVTGATGYLSICCLVADALVRWEDVEGDARLALLQLATVVARSGDGVRARRYLDVYYGADGRGARLPALSVLNLDLRLRTLERHAEGVVCGALDGANALSTLSEVSLEWRKLKYRFRADEARDDVRALTHRSYDRGGGQEELRQPASCDDASTSGVQMSVFAKATRTAKSITVTRRQDRIIRHFVQGLTVAEVAKELALEEKTVRNHLSKLYSMFEVAGLPQLIAAILRDDRLRGCFTGSAAGVGDAIRDICPWSEKER